MITRAEIEREFKRFVEKPLPGLIAGYGSDHGYLIVEVFKVIKTPSGLIGTATVSVDTEFVFPVGKVLSVGERWKGCSVGVGDLVRLRDEDAKTVENPRYEAWVNNPYKRNPDIDGNKVGETPPATLCNLYSNLGRKMLDLDVFEIDTNKLSGSVFALDEGNVICPVQDWRVFMTGAGEEGVGVKKAVPASQIKALA